MVLDKYIKLMPTEGSPDLFNTDLASPENIIETHLAVVSAYDTRMGGLLKMVHFQFLKMMGDEQSWQEIREWFKEADGFLKDIEGV